MHFFVTFSHSIVTICNNFLMNLVRFLSNKFSLISRKRKLRFVSEFVKNLGIENCLIVGAAQTNSYGYGNLIERGMVELGIDVAVSGLEEKGIGWDNWTSCDGRNLPFDPQSFDLVFSNAVVEHVGTIFDQAKFIKEHARVGRHWILTTPNRFFPIESHTYKFFLHMFRLDNSDLYTRLLSKSDLAILLPRNSIIRGHFFSPTFIAYCGCQLTQTVQKSSG